MSVADLIYKVYLNWRSLGEGQGVHSGRSLAAWFVKKEEICACATNDTRQYPQTGAGASLFYNTFQRLRDYRHQLLASDTSPEWTTPNAWYEVCSLIYDLVVDEVEYAALWHEIEAVKDGGREYTLADFTKDRLVSFKVEEELKYVSVERDGAGHLVLAPRDSVEPRYVGHLRTTDEVHHGRMRMTDEAVMVSAGPRLTDERTAVIGRFITSSVGRISQSPAIKLEMVESPGRSNEQRDPFQEVYGEPKKLLPVRPLISCSVMIVTERVPTVFPRSMPSKTTTTQPIPSAAISLAALSPQAHSFNA